VSERLPDEPMEPEFDPGLPRRRSEHGGTPRRDDDEFALAAERDRVAAGLEDYAPDDVPPAADPPPPEFPKRSIWRSEGCWTTPQSTRRTAEAAALRFRRLLPWIALVQARASVINPFDVPTHDQDSALRSASEIAQAALTKPM
jgi:hypothetical protein